MNKDREQEVYDRFLSGASLVDVLGSSKYLDLKGSEIIDIFLNVEKKGVKRPGNDLDMFVETAVKIRGRIIELRNRKKHIRLKRKFNFGE